MRPPVFTTWPQAFVKVRQRIRYGICRQMLEIVVTS